MKDVPEIIYLFCSFCDFQTNDESDFDMEYCPVCADNGYSKGLTEYTTEDKAIEDAERTMDELRHGDY